MSSSPTATPLMNSHPIDTPLNHRSILDVIPWTLAVLTTLVVALRLSIKFNVSRGLALDDVLILVSLALAFCQTGTLSVAVAHGFGLVNTDVPTDVGIQEKAIYAFNLLFVASQFFAKASVLVFLRALTPVTTHQRILNSILAVAGCWVVMAVLALLFQCHRPNFWQVLGNQCVDRVALFTAIDASNALLDVVLIVLPCIVTLRLNLGLRPRAALAFTFFTRIAVIATLVAQVVFLYHGPPSSDPFLNWAFALCAQLAEYLSISLACALYLKSFLTHAASGMIFNDDIRRREGLYALKPSYYRSIPNPDKPLRPNYNDSAADLDLPVPTYNLNPIRRLDAGPHRVDISSDHPEIPLAVVTECSRSSICRTDSCGRPGDKPGITQTISYLVERELA